MHAFTNALAGRHEDALAAAQHAVSLSPSSLVTHWGLLVCLLNAGRPQEALARQDEALEVGSRHPWMLSALAGANAAVGDREAARRLYDELVARAQIEYVQPATLAGVAASAGFDVEALQWAERAVELCDPTLVWSAVMPGWSALRELPGFEAVYARLGLGSRAQPGLRS
jgi:tetratricopeptide (TPR) repeat protein